jgi:hypothetical protein
MPGINPRHTLKTSFSTTCEAVPFVQSIFQGVLAVQEKGDLVPDVARPSGREVV